MNEFCIRPIKDDESYEDSLARVEALMDIERSDDENCELDALVTLIQKYEDRHYPMSPPNPIEAIKFRMEQMEMSQSDLAPILGSRAKTSEVLSGKRPLTLRMIRALHDRLGIPAETLIRDAGGLPELPTGVDLGRFPLGAMVARGWVEKAADAKDRVEGIVRGMIVGAGGPQALPRALFRQGGGLRLTAGADRHSLQAWCLHVLCMARRAGLEGVYEEGTITPSFLREVARLSSHDEGPKLAKERLAGHGVALVVAEHLPKTYLDGAALWTKEGVPVIGMTLRHDRLDNFWFCLLHELAHLGRHFAGFNDGVFIDDLQLRERGGEYDEREREADEWAQEALIPLDLWSTHPARQNPSYQNVLELAGKAGVHPSVVAGRIRYEENNYRLLTKLVGAREVKRLMVENAA